MKTAQQVGLELEQFFEPHEVKWKPQAVKGSRAMAIAYVSARAVMDRLDDVVGVAGWRDDYELLSDGSVACRLSVLIEGAWITKTDVGSQSEQPDGGDRMKSAFSDALKRAAVKFGVGRYLYKLPHQWAEYDPAKRGFVQPPTLPAWAIPKAAVTAISPSAQPSPPAAPVAKAAPPASGADLLRRLTDYDAKIGAGGKLLARVKDTAAKAGYGGDVAAFTPEAIAFATNVAKDFAAEFAKQPPV